MGQKGYPFGFVRTSMSAVLQDSRVWLLCMTFVIPADQGINWVKDNAMQSETPILNCL